MDFELSKENILPLVGGRNVQQLGMALQAQTNRESQLELMQQKEQWEAQIKSYTGDDPLDNYYKYISWIEQTYPKHGHEGNIVPLLEHCLKLFENDSRYVNERRFCKLWIKYFDLQPNPLELYHMMKAKGLCTGCADFYKAWAYYHEAAGDFQAANNVFEEGKKNCAQPYDELENAHQNLIMAAGQHMLYGPNECRLIEKRQALTSLHTYKQGRVSSIRVSSNNSLVTFPSCSSSSSRPNTMISVHEDRHGEAAAAVDEAPPISIITAAKRQDVPKENTLKAGPWTGTVPVKKRVISSGVNVATGFIVHEDVEPQRGIRLPKNYPKTSLEDYSDWHVPVSNPDPPNPAEKPMYPKHYVYAEPNKEYSIEEIRARRFKTKASQQPITIDDDEVEFIQESKLDNDILHRSLNQTNQMLQRTLQGQQLSHQTQQQPFHPMQKQSLKLSQSPMHQKSPMQFKPTPMQLKSFQTPQKFSQNNSQQQTLMQHQVLPIQHQVSPMQHQVSPMQHQVSPMQTQMSPMQTQLCPLQSQLSPMQTQLSPIPNQDSEFMALGTASTNFNLWQSPEAIPIVGPAFGIFEQSLDQNQPKGSAMKTAFKVLNADELAETGSRGGMDIAVTAQAMDSAKPMPAFSDSSSSEDGFSQDMHRELSDETADTNVFLCLNSMQVSTPQNKRSVLNTISPEDEQVTLTKKQLFSEPCNVRDPKTLSTILEETKGSNGSSGSTISNQISEEHNNNLAQNLKANAELRSSLLANLMDFGTDQPISQSTNDVTIFETTIRTLPAPANVEPLNFVPSDPFKSQLINQLLERVAFPGPHSFGYKEIPCIPRLCIKKEPTYIGGEKYILEKQLGKGTFGTVYKAIDLGNSLTVAMKYQKPANKWEFYICRELQSRLANHPLRERFMDIPLAYFGDQASLIISEYMPGGSLLDLANMHKQKLGKTMKECLVIYFCIQMLQIVKAMHEVHIIHADIKPDNFLICVKPDNTVGLQLIDFGCSIDMSLFPANASFRRRVTTEDFVCCEMLDGQPWNYHTDIFCIAATAHVLLFDTYIKLQKKDNLWSIQQRFPRYLKVDLWNMFFSSSLNQQNGPADAASMILLFEKSLETLNKDTSSALPSQIRYIINLLKNR